MNLNSRFFDVTLGIFAYQLLARKTLLKANHPLISLASMSHVSPSFAPVFGNCIRLLRQVLYTTDGQPFLVAGSGTLGWDAVGANLVEKGDKAVGHLPIAIAGRRY